MSESAIADQAGKSWLLPMFTTKFGGSMAAARSALMVAVAVASVTVLVLSVSTKSTSSFWTVLTACWWQIPSPLPVPGKAVSTST